MRWSEEDLGFDKDCLRVWFCIRRQRWRAAIDGFTGAEQKVPKWPWYLFNLLPPGGSAQRDFTSRCLRWTWCVMWINAVCKAADVWSLESMASFFLKPAQVLERSNGTLTCTPRITFSFCFGSNLTPHAKSCCCWSHHRPKLPLNVDIFYMHIIKLQPL